MKRTLLILASSILTGALFGLLLFKLTENNVKTVFNERQTLTFFQIGVFKSKNNAINLSEKIISSIVVSDEDFYRVYAGVFKSDGAITKFKDYLSSKNIDYYLKKVEVNNSDFIKSLTKYEEMLIKTNDEVVINEVVKEILEKYQEVSSKVVN